MPGELFSVKTIGVSAGHLSYMFLPDQFGQSLQDEIMHKALLDCWSLFR